MQIFFYSFLNLRRFLGDEVETDQFYIVKHVDVYKKRKKSYCCFLRAQNVDFFEATHKCEMNDSRDRSFEVHR